MIPVVCGIDPGRDGALVVIRGRDILASTPTADLLGRAKWQAAHAEVTGWIRSVHAEHRLTLAVLELYAGRAGEGGGSLLTVGVGWGLYLGCLSALGVPVLTPSSATWTRGLLAGIAGEGKERSVSFARQVLPDLDLTPGRRRKPHDGLADAGCLAIWGQRL